MSKDRIAREDDGFAFGFLRAQTADQNVFFSPLSLSTALAMAYGGAGGETATAFEQALGFDGAVHGQNASLMNRLNEAEAELHLANRIWPSTNIQVNPTFGALMKDSYSAVPQTLDYNKPEPARGIINGWVAEQTQQMIPDLLPSGSLTPETVMVLTNAVYFKGLWASPFEKDSTEQAAFATPNGSEMVPLMYQKGQASYAKNEDGTTILQLDYAGDDGLAMVLVLPPAGESLTDFEAGLSKQTWTDWTDHLREREVAMWIPRLSLSWGGTVKSTLVGMGLDTPFSANADFSNMTSGKVLISDCIHKARLEMDEKGTEAAAATGMVMRTTSIAMPPPEFRADRPFLLAIREKTEGTLLFLGRVVDPS